MINIEELTEEDVEKWVNYTPYSNSEKQEHGRIKSWNNKWIFVVYNCGNNWDDYQNYTAAATDPNDLNFN